MSGWETPRHRGNTRAAIALACSLALVTSAACSGGSSEPLKPTNGIRQLGALGPRIEVGNVTLPTLADAERGKARVPLRDLPPSRVTISLALSRKFGPNADPHFDCHVDLLRGDDRKALKRIRLSTRSGRWISREVVLPAVAEGELDLYCDKRSVTWARPHAVPQAAAPNEPLIVLISLDTLRADHVGGFGAARGATPNLTRLGEEGLRMLQATSSATWTLPAHYELFMSRLALDDESVRLGKLAWLPTLLAADGFLTLAMTGGGYVSSGLGFARGFMRFREYGSKIEDLAGQVDDAIAAVEQHSSTPAFLFFHTYAIHEMDPGAQTWFDENGIKKPYRPNEEQLALSRAWYARLVSEADAALAPLFESLRAVALQRPTLVVLLSDHGEAFAERGIYGHGRHLLPYDELIHIPFIVWGPGLIPPGRSDASPNMLMDVAPSILASAGITSGKSMKGRNLWPLWSDRGPAMPDTGLSVAASDRGWVVRDAEVSLLVQADEGEPGLEFYDLTADAGQRENLAKERPDRARELYEALKQRLDEFGLPGAASLSGRKQGTLGETDELDAETRDQLRELGYLE